MRASRSGGLIQRAAGVSDASAVRRAGPGRQLGREAGLRALGANTPIIVGDEPGAWAERGGALMFDALQTSGGKSDTRLLLIGTRAPGADGGWWRSLLTEPADPGTYRQIHDAAIDAEGEVVDWASWRTIRRALPLLDYNPHLRPKLEEELRRAKRSEDARRPVRDVPAQPATASGAGGCFSRRTYGGWSRLARFRPRRAGRSWASTSGARAPGARGRSCGLPAGLRGWQWRLECRGSRSWKSDGIRSGAASTTELRADGILTVDEGRRVVQVRTLIDRVMAYRPEVIVCDRFRLPAVLDAVGGRCRVIARVTRWSEIDGRHHGD